MHSKTLANQVAMPVLGFGVYQMKEAQTAQQAVYAAIQAGYRQIDTAASYGNERAVGAGIRQAIADGLVTRAELFVTSKMWVADACPERAAAAINATLDRLGLEYLDLYLLHQPYNDVFAAWRAMEAAYEKGQLRAIGVSNFSISQLANLSAFSKRKPMVNQIEVNPFQQNQALVNYCLAQGVQPVAWAPFAEGKHDLFQQPLLAEIAAAHHKSIAQVILRWCLQRDLLVVAKSSRYERMQENQAVFDFTLTLAELTAISTLDTGQSMFFDHADPAMIDWMATRSVAYE
ncbi:aldo/keto reductase [Leuconostocaceae bacterium ESL0958]|nr:aldo/keto reductase [Leuconostocaceae bacterium ESL0958]